MLALYSFFDNQGGLKTIITQGMVNAVTEESVVTNPTSAPLTDSSDQYRELVWLALGFGTDLERAWTHYSGFATIYFFGWRQAEVLLFLL